MKNIKFISLLAALLMATAILLASCNETSHLGENTDVPLSETAQCTHNYISKITTEANCVKDGVETFTCTMCNDSYTESIAATGEHNYTSKVTTEASCTKDGVETFTCTVCNDSYTESIAATGEHNYTSKVTTEASCTKNGIKTFSCSVCKYSYTESIEAVGHKWINATCNTPKMCVVCEETVGKGLGHTTNNGICSRCGKDNTNYYGELRDFIKSNGSGLWIVDDSALRPKEKAISYKFYAYYDRIKYEINFLYYEESELILTRCQRSSQSYYSGTVIYVLYTESSRDIHAYEFIDKYNANNCMLGEINAFNVNTTTNVLPYTSYKTEDASYSSIHISKDAARLFHIYLPCLDLFLNNYLGLGIENFGYENY